jgi:hypothetical protein
MNHRISMKVVAVVSAVFGLMLLLMPNQLVAMYGAPQISGPGIYNSMLLGASLVGYAAMNWMASDRPLAEIRPVLVNDLLASVLSFIVAVYRQLTVVDAPPAGWLNVALFFAFTCVFARIHFRGRADEGARTERVAPSSGQRRAH